MSLRGFLHDYERNFMQNRVPEDARVSTNSRYPVTVKPTSSAEFRQVIACWFGYEMNWLCRIPLKRIDQQWQFAVSQRVQQGLSEMANSTVSYGSNWSCSEQEMQRVNDTYIRMSKVHDI